MQNSNNFVDPCKLESKNNHILCIFFNIKTWLYIEYGNCGGVAATQFAAVAVLILLPTKLMLAATTFASIQNASG